MKCRHCNAKLNYTFIDLGSAPPSNAYLSERTMKEPEKWYPLKVLVCDKCWLVQTEDFIGADEIFSEEYAYFSSYSSSWLEHARKYTDEMIPRFNLNHKSMIVEIAANDGYLLQFFHKKKIPCYGIEPTHSTAKAAREKGITIIEEFFDESKANELVSQRKEADLIVANNVLAHVPNINDFVKGVAKLLKPEGVATFEFPHLFNLVDKCQFDTIYHEHYSYLSMIAVSKILKINGLTIFDVEELLTHGGSLRVYAQRSDTDTFEISEAVATLISKEQHVGMNTLDFYQGFQYKVDKIKNEFLMFVLEAQQKGQKIAAYGAAAKGNTLLNYSGIRRDLIAFVVDKNPAKQNRYLPGSRIPVLDEKQIKDNKPDYVIVLPWNLIDEVMQQLSYIRQWNGQFVIAIPQLKTL